MVGSHGALPPELQDGSRVGFVHSAETTSGVNGPGPRYTVFLSGCPLRCLYCHNPDTQMMRLGDRTTVKRLLAEVAKYSAFISRDGGLTLTGGEPLQQPEFVADVFEGAKQELGLHTALDTSGMGGMRASDRLLDNLDLVLLDIKAGNPRRYAYVTSTGKFDELLQFAARLLERGTRLWIRFVLVPGLTDEPEHVDEVAAICQRAAAHHRPDRGAAVPHARGGQVRGAGPHLPPPAHPHPVAGAGRGGAGGLPARGLEAIV